MAKTKKITQNINKDAGLLDLPKVKVPHSKWETKHSNYLSCNIGEIVPIYVDEVVPNEYRRVTMGMLSHMTTPIAPIFNAQYTEFRAFFVPHRLSADLLAGYKTRKSPWVKVFGEDNSSTNANIIVPLANQTLPDISAGFLNDFNAVTHDSQGKLIDALDYALPNDSHTTLLNFLSMSAYELIYQKAYRNQNRESATSSTLYRFLFDAYNRSSGQSWTDSFHIAQREKDYFTGSQPFTQKAGSPVTAGLVGDAEVKLKMTAMIPTSGEILAGATTSVYTQQKATGSNTVAITGQISDGINSGGGKLIADLSSAQGVNIETLRLMIKTQELLEKDMMYGSDYASSLNAHFGCAPMSLILEEPLELKKVSITSQMQPIFQSSSTSGEQTILGTIGANATTQSGEFEIVPRTKFNEFGYLIICAVHKAQNSYDSKEYKPKHIFKKSRFDFFTPELNDLGFQPVSGNEFNPFYNLAGGPVSYNEAWAEYRFKFNKVHGMFEPSRTGAYDFWTLACSGYNDIQSLYTQGVTELDRALSASSSTIPQFFDAYGFIEVNEKPMSLHSIPGMDGVI